jgi:hypothetical protein
MRSRASWIVSLIALLAGCAGPTPAEYFADRAKDTGYVVRVWDSRLSVGALAPMSTHLSVEVRTPNDPPGRGEIYEVWGWGDARIVRSAPPNPPLEGTAAEEDERRRLVCEIRGDRARPAALWIRDQIKAWNDVRRAANDGPPYVPWPGPNSNTFMANLIRECPNLRTDLPTTAVGKDWAGLSPIRPTTTSTGMSLDIGIVGVQLGLCEGVEAHFLGMTFGIAFWPPALKTPFGRLGVPTYLDSDASSKPVESDDDLDETRAPADAPGPR